MDETALDHELGPQPRQIPLLSVTGLVAVTLAVLIFGITQWQNSKTLAEIERLQTQQAEFTRARAPATRTSLCNLLQVAISVIPPRDPERRRALVVLKQNAQALECQADLRNLAPDVPITPPP